MKEILRPIDEELYKRILLTHRFGLSLSHTSYKGILYSLEELPFDIALEELKRSFVDFMSTKEHIEKLLNILRYALIHKLNKFSLKDSNLIIQTITNILLEFYNPDYYSNITETLSNHKILLVPLKTVFSVDETVLKNLQNNQNNHSKYDEAKYEEGNDKITHQESSRHRITNSEDTEQKPYFEKIKAIVLFDDRLIKINGLGALKMPGLKIYRTKPYDIASLVSILDTYQHSFEKPLDAGQWDKSLNLVTQAEKLHHITKKEQSVGNGSWLTCKLLIFSVVFSTVYEFCQAQGLKDLEIDPIALSVAESWYKLFIVDDRNRAVHHYLEMHGFFETEQPLSVAGRVDSLKNFLKYSRSSPATSSTSSTPSTPSTDKVPVDKEILVQISLKSLNWLLADYLKKGDIGEAHALVEQQSANKLWNPLFYAAKNGKNAIAEMLASNVHYMTDQEPNGNTPLHCAAARGNVEMCKIFLRYKAKNKIVVEAQNNKGETALHLAIKHNKLDVAELLIKADPTLLAIRNQQNQSALKLACDLGNTAAILRLLEHKAGMEELTIQDYPEDIQKLLKNSPKLR